MPIACGECACLFNAVYTVGPRFLNEILSAWSKVLARGCLRGKHLLPRKFEWVALGLLEVGLVNLLIFTARFPSRTSKCTYGSANTDAKCYNASESGLASHFLPSHSRWGTKIQNKPCQRSFERKKRVADSETISSLLCLLPVLCLKHYMCSDRLRGRDKIKCCFEWGGGEKMLRVSWER